MSHHAQKRGTIVCDLCNREWHRTNSSYFVAKKGDKVHFCIACESISVRCPACHRFFHMDEPVCPKCTLAQKDAYAAKYEIEKENQRLVTLTANQWGALQQLAITLDIREHPEGHKSFYSWRALLAEIADNTEYYMLWFSREQSILYIDTYTL